MIIAIDATGAASLREPDNFKEFKVVCAYPGGEAPARAVGRLEAEHLWVDRSWLLDAGRPQDAGWRAGFDAMVGFAERHGWVDPATGAIRAHIERAA